MFFRHHKNNQLIVIRISTVFTNSEYKTAIYNKTYKTKRKGKKNTELQHLINLQISYLV